jgi:transcriptional regulator GlxA family with amidase domain
MMEQSRHPIDDVARPAGFADRDRMRDRVAIDRP